MVPHASSLKKRRTRSSNTIHGSTFGYKVTKTANVAAATTTLTSLGKEFKIQGNDIRYDSQETEQSREKAFVKKGNSSKLNTQLRI